MIDKDFYECTEDEVDQIHDEIYKSLGQLINEITNSGVYRYTNNYRDMIKRLCRVAEKIIDDTVRTSLEGSSEINDQKLIRKPGQSHVSTPMYYPAWDKYVEIDCGIAELIGEIWEAGIDTYNSCENNDPYQSNKIWIEFASVDDFLNFVSIIFTGEYSRSSVSKRAFMRETLHGENHKEWMYEMNVDPFDNLEKDYADGSTDITVSLRFPRFDYDFVLNKLKEYNGKSTIENSSNSFDDSSEEN